MNREPIYVAIAALLAAVPGAITVTRRLRHWSDVPADRQPYICLAMGNESVKRVTGQPSRWFLAPKILVYATQAEDALSPSTILNGLIDAVESSIEPAFAAIPNQTLGGLVEYCRINGTVETDEGTLGSQAVAILPLEILVT